MTLIVKILVIIYSPITEKTHITQSKDIYVMKESTLGAKMEVAGLLDGVNNKKLVIPIILGIVLGFLSPIYVVTATPEDGGGSGNSPPNVDTPWGDYTTIPTSFVFRFYTYVTDPDGNNVNCRFLWDDGTQTDWIGWSSSGTTYWADKAWNSSGTYYVRAEAIDTNNESRLSSSLTVTVRDFTTDLNVPYHQQDNWNYCAPAVAQMWIEYKSNGVVISQDELFAYGHAHNQPPNRPNVNPEGLRATLKHYLADNLLPGFRYDVRTYTTAISGTRDMISVMRLYDAPSAASVYAGGHWVLVKGALHDYISDNEITTVYGFLVHDPAVGIGDTYATFSVWSSNFFLPRNTPGDNWDGFYTAVVCPPSDSDETTYEFYVEPVRGQVSENGAIEVAIEGLTKHRLFMIFNQYLDDAVPIKPIYVESIDNIFPSYYIVPFVKDGRISVMAIVDAEQGKFMMATPYDPGLIQYPTISAEEATAIVSQAVEGEIKSAKLVWKPCELSWSPHMPFWAIEIGNKTVYIEQQEQLGAQISAINKPIKIIKPTDDAHVAEGYPDINFGDRTALYLQSYTEDYKNERIFLKFNLSEIPDSTRIIQAKLHLYSWLGRYAPIDVQCYSVDSDDWQEDTITWNNQPSGKEILSTIRLGNREPKLVGDRQAAENKWHSWDVTSFVTSEFDGDKVTSFCLKAAMEGTSGQYAFESKEWSLSCLPYLEIIYAPRRNRTEGKITATLNLDRIANGKKWEFPVKVPKVQVVELTDDAHVAEGYPDNNFGDRTALYLQSYADGYKNERIFLKFNLGEIPNNSKIIKAELYLYCWRGRYGGLNIQCYSVEDDMWNEMNVTWNNQPSIKEISNAAYLDGGVKRWVFFDVSSFVTSEFDGDKVTSFCLKAAMEGMSRQYAFESKEWKGGTLAPHLKIIYVLA